MQKRSEANKEVKMLFRTKLKRTVIVVFCLLFAYSAIYAADVSTKRMLKKETENRYAMRVSLENEEMLRIDLAGTKHYLDVGDIMLYLNKLSDKTKGIIEQLKAVNKKL
ncbi:MAG: hypothetical protein WBL93_02625 [Lutisporaceae bacterium]